jgi:hypothetical protein
MRTFTKRPRKPVIQIHDSSVSAATMTRRTSWNEVPPKSRTLRLCTIASLYEPCFTSVAMSSTAEAASASTSGAVAPSPIAGIPLS